ncbi:hypothetical protein DAETH_17890 [Deinococcus aetherius]|uniref:Uncharacterized protein n=1 Tax=Deinococcus aetherius TaxID=200252 RepID=A0ABN6RGC0_9DEIO|nr:hypothetical protein DAETH_17890 [Deinococcus aetherius]
MQNLRGGEGEGEEVDLLPEGGPAFGAPEEGEGGGHGNLAGPSGGRERRVHPRNGWVGVFRAVRSA